MLGGKRSDIHVDRQVEQQAKPSPLIILAATISAGLCAKKIANAAKQHAENAEGGEFVFADSVNQHADEGAADERADIHYAADKAHHHATGAERFRKAGNYRRYQHWAGHVKKAGC